MQNPQNTTDRLSAATRAAITQMRAISESERRLAAAIDAATREFDNAEVAEIKERSTSHSQEDAFALGPADPGRTSRR